MKRFLCILMLILMMFSVAACGTKDNTSSKDDETKAPNSTAEPTNETPSEPASTNGSGDSSATGIEELKPTMQYIENILGDDISKYSKDEDTNNGLVSYKQSDVTTDFELDLTLDGVGIKAGTPVKDIIDEGYEMKQGSEEVEANHQVSPLYFTNSDKDISFSVTVYNDTDSTKAAKDCKISGINCDYKSIDYINYKGLTSDSSLQDVIDVFGKPKFINVGKITNRDPYVHISYFGEYENGSLPTLTIQFAYDGQETKIDYLYIN